MGKVTIIAAKNITKNAAEEIGKISKKPIFWKEAKKITTKLKSIFNGKPGVIQRGKITYYSGKPAFALEKQRIIKKGAITYVLSEPKKKTLIKKGNIFYDLTPPNSKVTPEHEKEQHLK